MHPWASEEELLSTLHNILWILYSHPIRVHIPFQHTLPS